MIFDIDNFQWPCNTIAPHGDAERQSLDSMRNNRCLHAADGHGIGADIVIFTIFCEGAFGHCGAHDKKSTRTHAVGHERVHEFFKEFITRERGIH